MNIFAKYRVFYDQKLSLGELYTDNDDADNAV